MHDLGCAELAHLRSQKAHTSSPILNKVNRERVKTCGPMLRIAVESAASMQYSDSSAARPLVAPARGTGHVSGVYMMMLMML
jgi:hypothetical protein